LGSRENCSYSDSWGVQMATNARLAERKSRWPEMSETDGQKVNISGGHGLSGTGSQVG